MAVLLASITAVFFAGTHVTAKRGMETMPAVSGLLVSLSVTVAITGFIALFNLPSVVTVAAIAAFVAAGLAGDGLGRWSAFAAVDRLGPSTAIPIQSASYPLISVAGGILVFSESVGLLQLIGVLSIVAGIWTITYRRDDPLRRQGPGTATARLKTSLLAYTFPVAAGIGFGTADFFRKAGVDQVPYPVFAAFVSALTGLVLIAVTTSAAPAVRRTMRIGPGWRWYVASGALAALAVTTLFAALDTGNVSVVGPIVAAQPLVVVLLSWLLLRDIERLTRRTVFGAVLTVLGVLLIALAT